MGPGADDQPALVVGNVAPRRLLEAGELLAEIVPHDRLQGLLDPLRRIEVTQVEHVGPPLARAAGRRGSPYRSPPAGLRLGNLDIVLAVPEPLVLVLHARLRGSPATAGAGRIVHDQGHLLGGCQGGKILRPDERVRPGDRRVVGVRLVSVRHAFMRTIDGFDQPVHGLLHAGPDLLQEPAIGAELILAVGRLDARAVPVGEGLVRGVLAVRSLAVGMQEGDEVRDPHVPPHVGEQPGVGLGVVPDVRAIQRAAAVASFEAAEVAVFRPEAGRARGGSRSARSWRREIPPAGSTDRPCRGRAASAARGRLRCLRPGSRPRPRRRANGGCRDCRHAGTAARWGSAR